MTGHDSSQTVWTPRALKDLIEGSLDPETIRQMQRAQKDEDRFEKVLQIEQERVPWKERILAPLSEHLYVVLKGDEHIVKCSCGYEFGSHKRNWKLEALVYERNPEDGEVYVGPRAADPDWVSLREFYCPGCGTQLEVDCLPVGHPIVFDAQLDIDGFYSLRPELKKRVFGEGV